MQEDKKVNQHRVLLLTTSRSYRGTDFLMAAEKLNVQIIQGIDAPRQLFANWDQGLTLEFQRKDEALQQIVEFARENPIDAVLAVDDSGTVLAAEASERLGLAHNSTEAVKAARNKYKMRQLLQSHSVPSPACRLFTTTDDLLTITQQVDYPCVVKPLNLNGSRGVIRADDPEQLASAIQRTTKLLRFLSGQNQPQPFLAESYIPGIEVALEGLMDDGQLIVLAIFDKPDPLVGPFFEETIYTTPSRLPAAKQEKIKRCAMQAAQALGLRTGPVHAEMRINEAGPWIIEVAGRSIGGLCSRTLQFGMETSLEELILRQACGLELNLEKNMQDARGVMMIPIPGSGLLKEVNGIEKAKAVNYVEGIEITAHLNNPLVPLPEGDGYLGFIFSKGPTPDLVETSLRKAHKNLQFKIEPLLPMIS